jgi:hypothetical protein
MTTTIAQLLDSYNSNTLWDMAREANLPNTAGKKLKKDDLLALMNREYFQPKRIKASYNRLTDLEKKVLNRLQLHGGETTSRLFSRELIRAKLVTAAPPPKKPETKNYWAYQRDTYIYGRAVDRIATPNDPKSTIYEDVIARLTLHGLIFSRPTTQALESSAYNYKFQFHPGEHLFIPEFVRQHLPAPTSIVQTNDNWQPAHTLQGDPQALLRDLYLYWDAVRRNPPELIKSGFVGKRGLKTINDALVHPDPTLDNARQEDRSPYLYRLRMSLMGLNLVKVVGGSLQINQKKGQMISEFWRKETGEQIKEYADVWHKSADPIRLRSKKAENFTIQYRAATVLAWQALSELLKHNAWLAVEDLLIALQDATIDFLFSQRSHIEQSRYSYYDGYYYNNKADVLADMDLLEQNFVQELVGGPLFQMGLVELGYETVDHDPYAWQAFRLTALGDYVLYGKAYPATAVTGQIIIQPNFHILAMGPVPLHLLAQIDLFAERQKTDRTAFEYHLSRESVYAAQQVDYPVQEVVQFLERHTTHDLPQNIRRSLEEWGAHHERIVFRQGVTLLQAADGALLEQLRNDPAIGKLLARPVGTAVALVKTKRQPELVERLQHMGILPAVSGANPEAADKSVQVAVDGRITSIHAVPSLHLSGRLARFTETEGTAWYLTEKSVGRAGGNRKKVQAILDELNKLNRGRLPAQIVENVKAWGHYYGSATIGAYTLIEFRDPAALDELFKHPDLKNYLHPFPAGDRALTAVAPENLATVQAILARLGVDALNSPQRYP